MTFEHISVLKNEVLEHLTFAPDTPARLIDGTLGGGGHSFALLEKYPSLELLGIDRDDNALHAASEHLAPFRDRIKLVKGNYSELGNIAEENGWNSVDGVLLDIGVSSHQIDTPERGFSWRENGPLDMRMDQSSPLTAARLLNRTGEEELCRIFRDYGEIRQARKLAAAVTTRRLEKPFAETADLVAVCDEVLGRARKGELPRPTLVFQALRIAVNSELDELRTGLQAAHGLLKTGGRLAVISFHSLEDRIVKNFMREAATDCICPPGLPVCCCNHRASLRLVTRHAVTAEKQELEQNRRSAPARLRVAEKC